MRTAEPVDLVAAADQGESAGEGVLNLGEDQRGGGKDALSLAEFEGDAFLLFAAKVFGDGTGDDASGQSSALLLQLGDPRPGVGNLGFGLALLLGQLDAEPFADRLLEVFG